MGSTDDTPWQALAAAKREDILGSIPEKWRLDKKVPTVDEQRNVTGAYIRQFLSPKEAEITETDAVGIVEKTTSGAWSAVEVAEAFCHRASLSHQLVRSYASDMSRAQERIRLLVLLGQLSARDVLRRRLGRRQGAR